MSIIDVLIFAAIALAVGSVAQPKIRSHLLLAASIVVVYWLQSRSATIHNVTFWLPMAALIFATASWIWTSPPEIRILRENWPGILTVIGTVFMIDLLRAEWQIGLIFQDLAAPRSTIVILAIVVISLALIISSRISFIQRIVLPALLLITVLMFVFIKMPVLNNSLYTVLSKYSGNPLKNNGVFVWLGFSYFAFRVIHTIRDRQSGKLPPVTFTDYLTYVFFFPAFTAGPIDRVERFLVDLHQTNPWTSLDWTDVGSRFFLGLFKKFVIADALASFALNANNATHVSSSGWFWILLYAYAFQIYFDFSGYTDIAIGLGKIVGVNLPENFNAPYLKPNLTLFWNSWHMTLTQWFRAYFFYPLQRWFRSARVHVHAWLLVMILQVSTMILIGLWHGIALNFVLWGLWHGMGLFVHNRWRERYGSKISAWATNPLCRNILTSSGIFLTFHYVMLGWIFFVLPASQIPMAIKMLLGFAR